MEVEYIIVIQVQSLKIVYLVKILLILIVLIMESDMVVECIMKISQTQ